MRITQNEAAMLLEKAQSFVNKPKHVAMSFGPGFLDLDETESNQWAVDEIKQRRAQAPQNTTASEETND